MSTVRNIPPLEAASDRARFSPGWDRCDRVTLRFVDPELERAYQHADQREGVQRMRTASLAAIVTWVIVAIVGPPAIGVPPTVPWVISGSMTAILLATAAASGWATTQRRRDAIGLGQQLAAVVAALVLTVATGTFSTYAMPAVMLTSVFGYSVTRHPFVGAVTIGIAYWLLFLIAASVADLGSHLMLQLLIVGGTVVVACVGAYRLERSLRLTFAQGRLVGALHERVDLLLHQYLSADIARALIDDPALAELGGRETEVTVLFADLRGYTAFAERLAPAEVVAKLNEAFAVAVPAILDEGGTVVQFMGDAIMAIFNAPTVQPDHAFRAARAALAIQRKSASLPEATGRPRFGIGVNTGPALVGNIGAAQVRNFSAVGDTTNLAARLQTFSTDGTVVIGATTYELIRDRAVVRSLGAPALKGKSQPVEAFELLGLR